VTDERRRARGHYRLVSEEGAVSSEGDGDGEVSDEALAFGPLSAEFLDVDSLRVRERVIELGLFPSGRLELSMLARRHDSFLAALGEARDRARLAGMLAHGIGSPTIFEGALREPAPLRPARLFVYATHLAVVPEGGDPFQVPYGALSGVSFDEDAYGAVLTSERERVVVGQLARQTDAFRRELSEAREAQGRRLSQLGGSPLFADGVGVPLPKIDSERLLDGWSAPEREEHVRAVLAAADKPRARLGLVELLDPDAEALAAKASLPGNVAAFLLAPCGNRVVLELLCGPSAATYVFEGELEQLNADLQALHFRRRALSLSDKEAQGDAGRPYRLALRRLEPLRRLRAATRARVVHNEGWAEAFRKAVAG